jgi:hypothetical protein
MSAKNWIISSERHFPFRLCGVLLHSIVLDQDFAVALSSATVVRGGTLGERRVGEEGKEAMKGQEGGAGRRREEEEGKEKRELLTQFVMFKNHISSFCHSTHLVDVAVSSAAAFETLME